MSAQEIAPQPEDPAVPDRGFGFQVAATGGVALLCSGAHESFRRVSVGIPGEEEGPSALRAAFRRIATEREGVARLVGTIRQNQGNARARLVRCERALGLGESVVRDLSPDRLEHANGTTPPKRLTEGGFKARITTKLRALHEERSALEQDDALLTAALEHGRMVLAELQAAFETVSRVFATMQLEADLARRHGLDG